MRRMQLLLFQVNVSKDEGKEKQAVQVSPLKPVQQKMDIVAIQTNARMEMLSTTNARVGMKTSVALACRTRSRNVKQKVGSVEINVDVLENIFMGFVLHSQTV